MADLGPLLEVALEAAGQVVRELWLEFGDVLVLLALGELLPASGEYQSGHCGKVEVLVDALLDQAEPLLA